MEGTYGNILDFESRRLIHEFSDDRNAENEDDIFWLKIFVKETQSETDSYKFVAFFHLLEYFMVEW